LLLVVRQVLVECRARGDAGLLELDDDQRQTVDEADQIRLAGVERAEVPSGLELRPFQNRARD
jgi:hypothetical protein